ncbi:succinate dehydrogenase assembly factor 2 [Hyphomicrobium methylovorum]|uniref:FAD assembly factor SdhE n=1 Tax=Hyphomicrobium methylovorum TaxID=84 RepID=UPI0015E7B873|nr:succinate dehydrogenase assembly factor 2 [Hyphomicrobium methylovorum]MBA2127809.1 succinate dehydrogenase assembly factor 2 [Hyphomicrobium methylovorum]
MTDDLDVRRRRAAYRSHHRGTKEMDFLLGRFADQHLPAFLDAEMAQFEGLLELPDPTLQRWILSGAEPDQSEFRTLIADIRVFHGL